MSPAILGLPVASFIAPYIAPYTTVSYKLWNYKVATKFPNRSLTIFSPPLPTTPPSPSPLVRTMMVQFHCVFGMLSVQLNPYRVYVDTT